MDNKIYLYIFTAAIVSYLIRVLPLTLIRKPIKNKFVKSFLFYVPYITLSVMTFPAIINSTQSQISGIFALVTGLTCAFFGAGLLPVASICCIIVFLTELFIK